MGVTSRRKRAIADQALDVYRSHVMESEGQVPKSNEH